MTGFLRHEERALGFDVAHANHLQGLYARTGRKVEAALIDVDPGLTNIVTLSQLAKIVITRLRIRADFQACLLERNLQMDRFFALTWLDDVTDPFWTCLLRSLH